MAAPKRVESTPIMTAPHVAFGREICDELEDGLRREWLVTNGLGGYASATLPGVLSRSYHGLLVAALEPPVARTVLVAGSVDWVTYAGTRYPLSTHEFGEGTFAPEGYRLLESFRLEGALPVWTFAVADALIERRLWMVDQSNTTYVTYTVLRGAEQLEIEITPLVTYHSFHALASGQGWHIAVEPEPNGARISAYDGAMPFWLRSDGAEFQPSGEWWWDFRHQAETERGLADHSDLFAPGTFRCTLTAGESLAVCYSTEQDLTVDASPSRQGAQDRQQALLDMADAGKTDPLFQQLILAADQFLVSRPMPDDPGGRSIIAGYHWFNDWGRDTMISLPGLTLVTGRSAEASAILRTFARYLSDGLLPNNFPDAAGVIPGYNTVDATLWYVMAIRAYEEQTGDMSLATDLLPALLEIVAWHRKGTRYGIGVDPADNLLRAGVPGVQLTWMDARVGDWVVTPRIGKPVEINALWYNAQRVIGDFCAARGDEVNASELHALAEQTQASFRTRFIRADREHLADVIDGPEGDDWSMRPNQLFALSLPFPLLEGAEGRTVLDAIGRDLLTSYGLRSLAPSDPSYTGVYGGDQFHRDSAYHQGTVWSWLLGPYAEARFRLNGDADAALALLQPMGDHLRDAGLGSVSEIFEGDPPYHPKGCIAQAWGVAETLRVWKVLSNASAKRSAGSEQRKPG